MQAVAEEDPVLAAVWLHEMRGRQATPSAACYEASQQNYDPARYGKIVRNLISGPAKQYPAKSPLRLGKRHNLKYMCWAIAPTAANQNLKHTNETSRVEGVGYRSPRRSVF